MGTEFICLPVTNRCDYVISCEIEFPGTPAVGASPHQTFWRGRGRGPVCQPVEGDALGYDAPAPRSSVMYRCGPTCDFSIGMVDDGLGTCACERGLEEIGGVCFEPCPANFSRVFSPASGACRADTLPESPPSGSSQPSTTDTSSSADTRPESQPVGTAQDAAPRETLEERRRRERDELRAQQDQQAREQQAQWTNTVATTVSGLQALATGPADVYKGPSWHFRVVLGTGVALAPIAMESFLSVDGGGSTTSSKIGIAAGLPAFVAGLRYDPYYSTNFAVSLFSDFLIGFNVLDASTSGRVMTGSLGLEVFLKFFGQYSGITLQSAYLWRNAYARSGFDLGVASSSGTGEGTLDALRFGGALSGCLTERSPGRSLPSTCGLRMLLGVYAELPMSDGYNQGVGIIGHLGISGDNSIFNIGLDFAPSYPAVGSSSGTGLLLAFTFAKSIDWFGASSPATVASDEPTGAPARENEVERAIAARRARANRLR